MEFSEDTVFTVLNFLRKNNAYDLLSFHYSEIPGGYSNQQIDFHLRYCRDNGFVEGDLSGDKIMALAYLTPEGLKHLQSIDNVKTQHVISKMAANSVFKANQFTSNEHLVFVLSPFGEPFDTIFADHIRPIAEMTHNLQCFRADDIFDNQPIIEDIWRSINEARIVIAELTGKNANVFYETGLAHAIGKEVILITQSMDDVPFDLRHRRCIVYEYTPPGIMKLEHELANTITSVLSRTTPSRPFPELPQGRNPMEMRVQELESQVEELEAEAESARYDDGS